MRRFFVGMLLLLVWNVAAEESPVSFRVSPPPVGYPRLEAGAKQVATGVTGTYASIDAMDTKITMLGGMAHGTFQQSFTDYFALTASLGAAMMGGNKYDLLLIQVPLGIQALLAPVRGPWGSLYLFGGAGGDMGVTTMTIPIPQLIFQTSSIVIDETRVSTTLTNGMFNGGAQVNMPAGDFILSLFGVYSYSAGSYTTTQTSTMSYKYPSSSGSIEGSSAVSLGCDLLYVPWNMALSSLVQNREDVTVISVGVKWLMPGL